MTKRLRLAVRNGVKPAHIAAERCRAASREITAMNPTRSARTKQNIPFGCTSCFVRIGRGAQKNRPDGR